MILEYNRVLQTLDDHTNESFLATLEEDFTVDPIAEDGSTIFEDKHDFTLCMRDSCWQEPGLRPEKLDTSNVISQLDS